jgi:hypothetical protein
LKNPDTTTAALHLPVKKYRILGQTQKQQGAAKFAENPTIFCPSFLPINHEIQKVEVFGASKL